MKLTMLLFFLCLTCVQGIEYKAKTQFPSVFNLANLDSKNGFSMNAGTQYLFVSNAGDVNDDGTDDLIIGAPYTSYSPYGRAGVSYVVFGRKGISESKIILSSLNGSDGFNITGIYQSDELSGWSVASAGDINSDGIVDIIIGAPNAGTSYVIFGSKNIGHSGTLSLSTLNGSNGFNITGTIQSGQSGWFVNSAGDINGDGIDDIVIGGPLGVSAAAYVIFGAHDIGSTGSISLGDLDGNNGFNITGIYTLGGGVNGIVSVGTAGDINDDGINDLIIGSPGDNSNIGASYIIFGAPNVGKSGTASVNTLNGTNGFKIPGIVPGGINGRSVAGIGDVNNDGIDDIITSASLASNASGVCYVIFGAHNIGSSGILSLSDLDGQNGFIIAGDKPDDQLGNCVSAAGDLNNDGIADILVRAVGSSSESSSYIIFGSSDTRSSGILLIKDLNGENGFLITGAKSGPYSGAFVSSAGDINNDGVDDIAIGSVESMPLGKVYIVFGDRLSAITHNSLTITGTATTLNTGNLDATYLYNSTGSSMLIFNFSNVQQGYFSYTNNPSITITSCTKDDIDKEVVQFVYYNTGLSPIFSTQVSDGGLASMSPMVATINFNNGFEIFENQLTIDQGKSVILTEGNLYANDVSNPGENPVLYFIVSTPSHGNFTDITTGQKVYHFQQFMIQSGFIRFTHDNSIYPPSFNVSVSNGEKTSNSQSCQITFYLLPQLINNTLTIVQGGTIVLSNRQLGARDPNMTSEQLIFTTTPPIGGNFYLVNSGVEQLSFTQAQIDRGLISFVQDGTATKPSYTITLTNGRPGISIESEANIIFTPRPESLRGEIESKIILGIVGGIVSLIFLLVKLWISHYVEKKQKEALSPETLTEAEQERETLYREVTLPASKKLFDHINTTYFMGYRSESDTKKFIHTFELIITHLHELDVEMDINTLTSAKQTRLFNEIVRQTKKTLVPERSMCSRATIGSFFVPDIKPGQVESNASIIAQSIANALKKLNTQDEDSIMSTPGTARDNELAPLIPSAI